LTERPVKFKMEFLFFQISSSDFPFLYAFFSSLGPEIQIIAVLKSLF